MLTIDLLSAEEVADRLGVSLSTLADWRQTASVELPFVRIRNRIFYRPEDVETFLQESDSDESEDDIDADGEAEESS